MPKSCGVKLRIGAVEFICLRVEGHRDKHVADIAWDNNGHISATWTQSPDEPDPAMPAPDAS